MSNWNYRYASSDSEGLSELKKLVSYHYVLNSFSDLHRKVADFVRAYEYKVHQKAGGLR